MVRKRKSEKSQLIKSLDSECSKAVRARGKYQCAKCGVVNTAVHAAHIFSRGNFNTRWDTDNFVVLCFYCHIFWSHRKPVEFVEWVKQKIGNKKFKELEKKSREVYQFHIKDYEKILYSFYGKKT